MYKLMNIKKAKILGALAVVSFLFIHIFLLLMFHRNGVIPMVYFNIGSICFYLFLFYIVYRGMFRFYVVTMYLEVVLHMTAASIFTGWESGFQVTLIAMSILLFYSEYLSRYLKQPYVPTFPMCLLGPASYMGCCIWNHFYDPKYPLPVNTAFSLQLFWGLVVFCISIAILYIFVELCVESEEYLENEVGHDQLTGLPNRYYFADSLSNLDFLQGEDMEDLADLEDEAEKHTERTAVHKPKKASASEGYWAAMLDIDDFKRINDSYGHNCGDFVLKEVAKLLLSWKKECGTQSEIGLSSGGKKTNDPNSLAMTIGRWGGEEFLVVGRGADNVNELLEKLRTRIMNYDFVYRTEKGFGSFSSKKIRVTVTIGLALYEPGMTVREWIGAADARLYKGKKSGKNKVVA